MANDNFFFFINFVLNLLVLFWYRCYYLHRGRYLVSPVCGIFLTLLTGDRSGVAVAVLQTVLQLVK